MEHGHVVAMLSARRPARPDRHAMWRHEIEEARLSARPVRRPRLPSAVRVATRRSMPSVAAQTRQRPASSG